MYQADELGELISLLRSISEDILVYTGYDLHELPKDNLRGIAVLIDGEYIERRNTGCVLRGSDNQKIHILDKNYARKYEEYISAAKNQIQNFMCADGIVSVGIHKPDFINDLNKKLTESGLCPNE